VPVAFSSESRKTLKDHRIYVDIAGKRRCLDFMQTSGPLRLACILIGFATVTAHAQVPVAVGTTPGVAMPAIADSANAVATPTTLLPINLPPSVLPATGNTALPAATGETSITLDVAFGIRAVPPSRVTVPAGETLRITGPSYGGRAAQWSKNGQDIPGATSNPLVITSVSSSDAGTYALGLNDPRSSIVPSQALVLGVGPVQRLSNLSNRSTLAAGAGQVFTAGFVVSGGSSTAEPKKLIIRAVGPTLTAFGIANPLRAPVLRIFDASGKAYSNGYVYSAVVGGLTYETDLAASLAKVGAFPIPANTLDAVIMLPFAPGAYTAQVSSGDSTAGEVLLEVYEVP
jgi:hypothetical protein